MALVQNALIGRTKGSVGNVTFTTWKGKNVLKTKAINAYSNPTDNQLFNNLCFMKMVALYRSLALIVSLGFKELAIGKSEYNAFMQQNPYSVAITGTGESAKVDSANLIVSKGSLINNASFQPTLDTHEATVLKIDWEIANNLPASVSLAGAIFKKTTGMLVGFTINDTNSADVLVDVGEAVVSSNDYDAYVFAYDKLTGKATDSIKCIIV